MNYNKNSIHCPYCGTEMQLYYEQSVHSDCEYVAYRCPKCFTESPMKMVDYLEPVDKARNEAYISAITRWKEPNRMLTFAEINEINKEARRTRHQSKPLWIERRDSLDSEGYIKINNWGTICPSSEAEEKKPFPQIYTWILGHPQIGEVFYASRYNQDWRCWLREPTEKELKETLWGGQENV